MKSVPQTKYKGEHTSISDRYQSKDWNNKFSKAQEFGSFGESKCSPSLDLKTKQGQLKIKKPSIWDDDELLFAVAQNSPK